MNIKPEKPESTQKPMASAKNDVRQLRDNTSATVAELKVFLRQLKGKSPQEMLGMITGSQLVRAIGLSTVIVLATTFVFTAIPYALGGGEEKRSKNSKKSATPTLAGEAPAPAPEGGPKPATTAPGDDESGKPNITPLGVSEEKKAPPNVNPLENKKDDFLQGLE